MQTAIIEFARTVCGLDDSHSSECAPECDNAVISLMESQQHGTDMGGTMRLGAYPCRLPPGSRVAEAYGARSPPRRQDRKSTRLNSSHTAISYAVFSLKKKKRCRYAAPQSAYLAVVGRSISPPDDASNRRIVWRGGGALTVARASKDARCSGNIGAEFI